MNHDIHRVRNPWIAGGKCLLILMLSAGTIVGTDSIETILARMASANRQVQDFQAISTQTTRTSLTTTPRVETARFYRRGTSSRREIQKPTPKIVIDTPNGSVEKDLVTGTVTRATTDRHQPMTTAANWSQLDDLERYQRFNLSVQSETTDEWVLTGHYDTVDLTITVAKQYGLPTRFRIVDSSAQLTMDLVQTITQSAAIPVVQKIDVTTTLRAGAQVMTVGATTEYRGIKINQGLPDSMFDVTALGIPQ
ncbi:hypothetical protein EB093_06325 [bacterium]|nr:hypothetical protein [bacterium]